MKKYILFFFSLLFANALFAEDWLFILQTDGKYSYYNTSDSVKLTIDNEFIRITSTSNPTTPIKIGLSTVFRMYLLPWDTSNGQEVPYLSNADVNKDHRITVSDATDWVDAQTSSSSNDNLFLDLNGDGNIDLQDLNQLMNILLGK